jgi:hypothetical protein
MMKPLAHLKRAALAAAMALLAQTSGASAYTYIFENNSGHVIVYINMHTVSAFCHDISWEGRLAPNGTFTGYSAGICLVDRVFLKSSTGETREWSGAVGRVSTTFKFRSNRQLEPDY